MTAGRTSAILERFPNHLGATDPGKRMRAVVDALAAELDVLGRQVGDVRRARRLGEAPTMLDLLRVAALHRVGEASLAPAATRVAHLASLAGDELDLDALSNATGIARDDLADADPDALAAALAVATSFEGRLDRARAVVAGVVGAHARGNATVDALLRATSAYVGLPLTSVWHSEDRWWHVGRCRDVTGPQLPGVEPIEDVVALEENPFQPGDVAPARRRHGDRFVILRGGLEPVDVTVHVHGVGDRTVAPMVVDLDSGRGVAFTRPVPDGHELAFESSGRVTLAGSDVTGGAFGFEGGVFASSAELHPRDFVFDDAAAPGERERAATFAVTQPLADAFQTGAAFPHAGATVRPLRMSLGQSRWAFFVRVAHYAADVASEALPTTLAGRFDGSVFANAFGGLEPSAEVGFSWEEREPFALRVLLPRRMSDADDDDGARLREPLRVLLDRHRAAGVRVIVEYADERWSLGSGVLRDADASDPIGTVVAGTTLWSDGTPQPENV
ncbi:MAG TPA: hypothetical protein VHJ34_13960 [Actinomycetota bacterium]|nr:hypothetical protein [Actinomycetota bacterium]